MKAASAGSAAPPAPAPLKTCRPIHFQTLPGISKSRLSCVPLFREIPRETLLAEFRDAPQFSKIRLRPLLEDTRGAMRVLLLAENGYYAAQAAAYLASLSLTRESLPSRQDSESFWDYVDLSELESPEDPDAPSALRRQDPEGFGNGREARRLFQGAVEELALRALDTGAEALTLQDLQTAADRLQVQPGTSERVIGFQ